MTTTKYDYLISEFTNLQANDYPSIGNLMQVVSSSAINKTLYYLENDETKIYFIFESTLSDDDQNILNEIVSTYQNTTIIPASTETSYEYQTKFIFSAQHIGIGSSTSIPSASLTQISTLTSSLRRTFRFTGIYTHAVPQNSVNSLSVTINVPSDYVHTNAIPYIKIYYLIKGSTTPITGNVSWASQIYAFDSTNATSPTPILFNDPANTSNIYVVNTVTQPSNVALYNNYSSMLQLNNLPSGFTLEPNQLVYIIFNRIYYLDISGVDTFTGSVYVTSVEVGI